MTLYENGVTHGTQPNISTLVLNELTVELPDRALLINNQPFGYEVDDRRLVDIVNDANYANPRGYRSIESVSLDLVDGDPWYIVSQDNTAPVYTYGGKRTTLHLTLPKEIAHPTRSTDEIKELAQSSLNHRLEAGVLELAARDVVDRRERKIWISSVTLGVLAGTAAGVEVEQFTNSYAWPYTSGISAATLIVAGGALLVERFGRENDKSMRKWAFKRVGNEYSGERIKYVDENLFVEPVIRLVPNSETQ